MLTPADAQSAICPLIADSFAGHLVSVSLPLEVLDPPEFRERFRLPGEPMAAAHT